MNGAYIHIINASIFKSKLMLVNYEIIFVYLFLSWDQDQHTFDHDIYGEILYLFLF